MRSSAYSRNHAACSLAKLSDTPESQAAYGTGKPERKHGKSECLIKAKFHGNLTTSMKDSPSKGGDGAMMIARRDQKSSVGR